MATRAQPASHDLLKARPRLPGKPPWRARVVPQVRPSRHEVPEGLHPPRRGRGWHGQVAFECRPWLPAPRRVHARLPGALAARSRARPLRRCDAVHRAPTTKRAPKSLSGRQRGRRHLEQSVCADARRRRGRRAAIALFAGFCNDLRHPRRPSARMPAGREPRQPGVPVRLRPSPASWRNPKASSGYLPRECLSVITMLRSTTSFYARVHWNATVLVPSGLVAVLEMTCGDPRFMQ